MAEERYANIGLEKPNKVLSNEEWNKIFDKIEEEAEKFKKENPKKPTIHGHRCTFGHVDESEFRFRHRQNAMKEANLLGLHFKKGFVTKSEYLKIKKHLIIMYKENSGLPFSIDFKLNWVEPQIEYQVWFQKKALYRLIPKSEEEAMDPNFKLNNPKKMSPREREELEQGFEKHFSNLRKKWRKNFDKRRLEFGEQMLKKK